MKSEYLIRQARISDLEDLILLEQEGFTKEEAASKEAFAYRINHYPEWFFVVENAGQIIAFCNGCVSNEPFIKDELYEEGNEYDKDGKNLLIFGLVVSPKFQHRGIASELLNYVAETAARRNRITVALTCRERLVSFYEKSGFTNMGISKSVHGGIRWFDMRRILDENGGEKDV